MKVVHIHLKEPYEWQSDFYFGSVKAIYDHIPKEKVGITYKALTNALNLKGCYENKCCTIIIGQLIHKSNSRTKKQ